MSSADPIRLFLVTGMSGAGKSSALNALEDLGFETVDNLPVYLLEAALRGGGPDRPLAVGMDVRTRDFDSAGLLAELEGVGGQTKVELTLIFLECDDDILVRRYTETRRPHPLDADLPVGSAIEFERRLVAPLKAAANEMIDTSTMTTADLKRSIENTYGNDGNRQMHIHLVSFGYRHGLPREADLVFDVRFLRNPHYVSALREKTGLDKEVGDYVTEDSDFESFMENFRTLLVPLLLRYRDEGKSYLTIAIGCTGGHHRSVFVVEEISGWLATYGYGCDQRHRDIET